MPNGALARRSASGSISGRKHEAGSEHPRHMSGIAITSAAMTAQAGVLFWSTQARPEKEAQALRRDVLSGRGPTVGYQPTINPTRTVPG